MHTFETERQYALALLLAQPDPREMPPRRVGRTLPADPIKAQRTWRQSVRVFLAARKGVDELGAGRSGARA